MFDAAKAEALKERLVGCFYTIFTPFNAQEEIDYDALGAYLRHLYDGGARRFYAMAYNSRYSQMSTEEIRALNRFCAEALKRIDRENIVIVGDPIHCSTWESAEVARDAKDAGADLLSAICREKYFSDAQMLEHFAQVGAEGGLPLLVHEMPFLSGANGKQMHWPMSLLEGLTTIPEVIALKEDAKEADITRVALKLEPRIRIIIAGRKSAFMPFRPDGARAYLNGISIIDAGIGEAFWAAYEADDQATIDYILSELEAPFFDSSVAKYGWHRTNKALLEATGLMSRRDRMPLKHLSDAEFADVKADYAAVAAALERAPWAKRGAA